MKLNFGREISYSKLERKSSRRNSKDKSLPKSNIRNKLNSQNKSIEKLSELNSDIEKLYKKYAEVKKQRLMKEKSQQILVNRLKVLRHQQNSSKNKENVYNLSRPSDKKEKIHVRINSKYKKSNNLIKRYKESEKKNDFNESEIKNINFRTINNRKDSNIEKYSNSIVEDKHYHNHHIGKMKGNKDNRTLNNNDKNLDSINNIDDFLQKYKYNIGNKNSNNNIYIIINNPNNYTEQQTSKKNDEKNAIYDYDNELSNEELSKRHIKSDFNLDFERRGEKIILMNTDGRKIEDIIKSINSISSMNNNNNNTNDLDNLNNKIEISSRRSYKTNDKNDKNDNKKEYIIKENCDNHKSDDKNNENKGNNCIKDNLNDKDNIISKEDSIDINIDNIKNNIDKNNNNDIIDNIDINKNQDKIKEKEKEEGNIQIIEFINNKLNNNKENNNKKDESNKIIIENQTKEKQNGNNNNNTEDNNNENLKTADNDKVRNKDNENKEKEKEKENNINENEEKPNLEEESKNNNKKKLNENDNKTQEFIRPNFLDLYKNEDNFSISRQKIDISIYQTTNQKSLTPNRKTENKLTIKDEEKENDNLNSNLPNNNTNNNNEKNSIIKNMKYHKYNNTSQDPQNNQICLDLSSLVSNSASSKKQLRTKIASPSNKMNMNISTNKSNKNSINLKNDNNKKESEYIYLNGKKLEDMYINTTKNTNAQTICASSNDYNKLATLINKNEENNDNKDIVSNSLCTPKKLENNNKVKVNKKADNSFPNNQKLYLCEKVKASKNINLKKKNSNGTNYNNLINNSLSFKGFSNNSNYNSTHNTRRNSNFEKIRKNNFRKDTYCTSIEKKRRALGLQFNPNFDKELSMQTDKGSFSKKILEKFKTYKVKKKDNKSDYKTINSNDYSMDKHKLIKVNKRDEGNSVTLNMERINETPQRFKIIKSNVNKHKFVKNKTTTNFNYGRKGMNNDLKKSVNDLKNKNLKKGNNIFSKYILSDNNNSNSLSQINQVNDNSNISVGANKTINIV